MATASKRPTDMRDEICCRSRRAPRSRTRRRQGQPIATSPYLQDSSTAARCRCRRPRRRRPARCRRPSPKRWRPAQDICRRADPDAASRLSHPADQAPGAGKAGQAPDAGKRKLPRPTRSAAELRCRPPTFPIPVTVLTGFLGAGKTTCSTGCSSDPALADTAVIINEFGEVAIDHLLVEQCLRRRHPAFRRLPVLHGARRTGRYAGRPRSTACRPAASAGWPASSSRPPGSPIRRRCCSRSWPIRRWSRRSGSTASSRWSTRSMPMATLDAHVEAVKQVAVADRIVVTKSDIAERQDRGAAGAAAAAQSRRRNPRRGRAVRRPVGRCSNAASTIQRPRPPTLPLARRGVVRRRRRTVIRLTIMPGMAMTMRPADMIAASLRCPSPRPAAAARGRLYLPRLLEATHGERLLRLKGIVELAEDGSRPLVRPRACSDLASAGPAAGLAGRDPRHPAGADCARHAGRLSSAA